MRRLIDECPSCGSPMIVTELSCTACDTVMRGKYRGCTFCHLPDEDLRFLEIFVTCRGNVKQMERETGLGYWTIRGKLDDVIQALRLDERDQENQGDVEAQRRGILEAVERGELDIGQAERMLAALSERE